MFKTKLRRKIDNMDLKIEECIKPDIRHLLGKIDELNEKIILVIDHLNLKFEDPKMRVVKK